MAMPLDPDGSPSPSSSAPLRGATAPESPYNAARSRTLMRSMSPPMLPSVNDSAIHGSKCVITRGLTQPAQCVQVVRLDAVEVVLCLRVLHSEHGVRIGFAVHVRDAPVVADDRDVLRLTLPAGDIARGRRGACRIARRHRTVCMAEFYTR